MMGTERVFAKERDGCYCDPVQVSIFVLNLFARVKWFVALDLRVYIIEFKRAGDVLVLHFYSFG